VTEQQLELPAIEVVTETAWISGHLSRDQASDAANLSSVLNLDEYGLRGRSMIESGRLVDVLNRDRAYITVCEARIQPFFPLQLLDRHVEQVAVSTAEILCAAPLRPDTPTHGSVEPASTGAYAQPARERRTIELQIGPILVSGDFHIVLGSDPVAAFFQRDLDFVPLTSATVTYLPEPQRSWVREVLIVNKRRAQILMSAASAEAAGP